MTLSPDGKHLYVAGVYDDTVAVFSRNSTTGVLTFVEVQKDGVGGVDGLDEAWSVTVSPDGNHLYAAGRRDSAVAVFSRSSLTGALSFVEFQQDGVGGVDGLDTAEMVTVSPDGRYLYGAGPNDNAVAVFSRSSSTGALTFVEVQRDGVGGVDGLSSARSVTVSPDGNHLYATGAGDDAVAVFSVSHVADLAVSKSVDGASPEEGETVTFTVTVTNKGPDAATGVVVNDVIPSELTLQSATPSDGAYSAGTGNWTLSSLAAGADATIVLVAVADEGTGGTTITNTALITASDAIDSNGSNDSASAAVTVAAAPPLPIPSVGTWGLAIMVTAFALGLVWRLRRRVRGTVA